MFFWQIADNCCFSFFYIFNFLYQKNKKLSDECSPFFLVKMEETGGELRRKMEEKSCELSQKPMQGH